ncbi:hypothetical protein GTQ99_22670, partial [Kineococcus sp. T13]|uniref:Pr6Pr family membrane protein n=1 Tax=Kineococcus vitellinus TaxID=2696565 RepID=UPI001412AD61
ASTALRLLALTCVLAGVLWDASATFAEPRLGPAGLGAKLVFFTIQSNLLLAAVLLWSLLAGAARRRQPPPLVVGGATFFVTVTFAVYNTVLVPGGGPGAVLLLSGRPASDLLHVAAPLLALVDWVFGRPHPGFSVRRSLVWLLYPLAYAGFALVRGQLTNSVVRYPYWFLDVDRIGWGGVSLAVAVFVVAFGLLAVLFALADRFLGRFPRRAGGVLP